MEDSDLDHVLHNENLSYPHPWTRRIFQDCLRSGYECWVLEEEGDEGVVAAHAIMSIAADECHLLTLCVNPACRRRGLARQLLQHVLEQARAAGAQCCFLEVRPSNEAAQQLYYGEGFVRVGERRNYYPTRSARDKREDALILSRSLGDDPQ
ncbi:MAG: ribosomal protein S18-alanine N-acetyltransferase [Pseudohongiellaceae bacterium]